MNQILSVENKEKTKEVKKPKNRNNGPVEIEKIVKFFSFIIILFGVFLIASSSYSIYTDNSLKNKDTKPLIYLEKKDKKELLMRIEHDKPLATISYFWNDEEETQIPTNDRKQIDSTIEIPSGTNVLNIKTVDINNVEATHHQTFTVEADIDINIEPEGTKLKISAEGRKNLLYMTYRWDEDEEIKVDINDIQIDQVIDIPKGDHELTVIVVDENNETETKKQNVKGVTKPKLEITTDGAENFIIKAQDDQGIKKVEFKMNGKKYVLKLDEKFPLEERKEFEYSYPFEEGKNVLKVTVYNENDVTETKKVIVNL